MSKGQKDLHNFFTITDKSGKKIEKKEDEIEEEKVAVVDPNFKGVDFPRLDDFVDGLQSWKDMLKPAWSQKYFQDIHSFLVKEYKTKKIYPPADKIFNAFALTPVNKIKVVIVGQDPYHQPGQAMVPKGIKTPPSLQNIYKSLKSDPKMPGFKVPKHGDLTKWAMQGVFLLNAVLTVQDSTPNCHKACGWNKFTDQVIEIINKECNNVVFMLWGADAQKKAKSVNESK